MGQSLSRPPARARAPRRRAPPDRLRPVPRRGSRGGGDRGDHLAQPRSRHPARGAQPARRRSRGRRQSAADRGDPLHHRRLGRPPPCLAARDGDHRGRSPRRHGSAHLAGRAQGGGRSLSVLRQSRPRSSAARSLRSSATTEWWWRPICWRGSGWRWATRSSSAASRSPSAAAFCSSPTAWAARSRSALACSSPRRASIARRWSTSAAASSTGS